jgi:hypothetical protein
VSSPVAGPDEELAREPAESARAAYVEVAVGGDLEGATRPGPEPGGSLWATAARARLLFHGDGDLDAAHRLLVDALAENETETDPAALTAALDTLLMICRFADRPALWSSLRALAVREPAPPAGDTPPDVLDPEATVRAGWSLLAVDAVERRGPALRRVLDDGPRGGAAGSAIEAAVLLALDAFAAGRWDDAAGLAEQGRELCASSGHQALGMLAAAVSALVAAGRGDEVACRDHTSAMIGWAAPRGARLVHHYATGARVLAALGQGDAEAAYHLAAAVTPAGLVDPDGPGRLLVVDLVEAAVRTQRHDEAVAHARAARE